MHAPMISAQTARRAVWRPLWELPGRGELIFSLARRELVARYRGSVLGIIWALLSPVVMIAIFTFIFAGIFGDRFWSNGSPWDYRYIFLRPAAMGRCFRKLGQSADHIVTPFKSGSG